MFYIINFISKLVRTSDSEVFGSMTCVEPDFSSDLDGCAACKDILKDESKDGWKISFAPGPYLTYSTLWSKLAENYGYFGNYGQDEVIIESPDYGVEDWCPDGNGQKIEIG